MRICIKVSGHPEGSEPLPQTGWAGVRVGHWLDKKHIRSLSWISQELRLNQGSTRYLDSLLAWPFMGSKVTNLIKNYLQYTSNSCHNTNTYAHAGTRIHGLSGQHGCIHPSSLVGIHSAPTTLGALSHLLLINMNSPCLSLPTILPSQTWANELRSHWLRVAFVVAEFLGLEPLS